MIPAAAVEAAAKVLWDKEMNAPWSSVADGFKAPFMRDARAALEAAAPYIRAQALEDAAAEVDEGVPAYGQGEYADWLRAQAASERGSHGDD